MLVGNKCDDEQNRVVTTDRGMQLARQIDASFIEVSAYENINIDKAFNEILKQVFVSKVTCFFNLIYLNIQVI